MPIDVCLVSQELALYLRKKLLAWEQKNYPTFPWRDETHPFHALVAEVLLQRTRAEQVVPVYLNFIRVFPNPANLAQTNIPDIEKVIAPLGLRWRAKFLHELGKELVAGGSVPADLASLRKLPGVGPYAASAYLSFHVGRRVPIVDSNVVRFYGRFFGFRTGPETRRDRQLFKLADSVTPKRIFKKFNYAIIDFTRAICRPKPLHDICPLAKRCAFYCERFGESSTLLDISV
jgi:A/G-specific adenine glycosylase